jgi:hypothetical protein
VEQSAPKLLEDEMDILTLIFVLRVLEQRSKH